MQERMSSLFLDAGYENIYLAIGVAATALFVIETLVRVYRIYEDNNKRRRKRKRSTKNLFPEEMDVLTKQVIKATSNSYDYFWYKVIIMVSSYFIWHIFHQKNKTKFWKYLYSKMWNWYSHRHRQNKLSSVLVNDMVFKSSCFKWTKRNYWQSN